MRAALVGGPVGPTGWTISDGLGAARPVTLEALLCVQHQLRVNGDTEAGDDLYRQVTVGAVLVAMLIRGYRNGFEPPKTRADDEDGADEHRD